MDISLLRNIPLFAAVSNDELAELATLLEVREYAPRQPIVFLGDTGAEMFIVQSGRVVVSYPDETGHEVTIEEMGPGAFFGEISLLDGGPRTTNITAATAVTLLSLPREAFVQFMLQRPSVAVHVVTVLGARQRGLLEKLRGIGNVNEADLASQTTMQRRLSRVASLFASERFLVTNLLVIAAWIGANLALMAAGRLPFDEPPTFFWLGFVISVEAIVVTMFVLNAQRHQTERDRIRADFEYQVNVKAHMEVMELHRKLDRLLEATERVDR